MLNKIADQYRRPVYHFAEGGGAQAGGLSEEQLASINAYLQTNPSAEALAAAQQQFGVSDAGVAAAREYGKVGSAPGSNVPNAPTGPVVGGGGYSEFTPSGGTTEQGYSQNYSPEQMVSMRGTFKQYENDPQKLMELMNQYGVNVRDLSLAMGGSEKGYQNKFLQAGAAPSFGGMDDYQATAADKSYLNYMLQQPNPLGQGTLADVYKKQGIDPYTDPRVLTQAREENERLARRNEMRTAGGAAPIAGFGSNNGGGGGGGPGGPGPGPGGPGPGGPGPGPGGPGPGGPGFGVTQPPTPFTGPNGTIYPNSIQTPQGPQPTYFPTSWWTSSPSASRAYGQTTPSTARNFDAEMANYRAKYAPVYTLPKAPPVITPPSASTPVAPDPTKPPTEDPGSGMEWKWDGSKWVAQPVQPAAARGGEVNKLWNKYHGR